MLKTTQRVVAVLPQAEVAEEGQQGSQNNAAAGLPVNIWKVGLLGCFGRTSLKSDTSV